MHSTSSGASRSAIRPPATDYLQRVGLVRRRGREPDLERRPAPWLAADLDLAAVQVDERLDDRQPEASAGNPAAGPGGPVEALEDVGGLGVGHAHAGVGDDDPDPGAVGLGADVDPAALGRVQVGVGQQVADDLCDVDSEMLVLGVDPGAHQLRHLANRLADLDRPPVQGDVIGVQAGDVEQLVDERHQTVGGAADDVDELTLAGRVPGRLGAVGEQLDEPLDRCQRAAQLMRGGRQEVALDAIGGVAFGQARLQPRDGLQQPAPAPKFPAQRNRQRGDHERGGRDDENPHHPITSYGIDSFGWAHSATFSAGLVKKVPAN